MVARRVRDQGRHQQGYVHHLAQQRRFHRGAHRPALPVGSDYDRCLSLAASGPRGADFTIPTCDLVVQLAVIQKRIRFGCHPHPDLAASLAAPRDDAFLKLGAAFLTRLPAAAAARALRGRLLRRRGRGTGPRSRDPRAAGLRRAVLRQPEPRLAHRGAALFERLLGTPVRGLGWPARRRPRAEHRRDSSTKGRRFELQLKGAGRTPYSRMGERRPRRAALLDPRIPVLRSDASSRHPDHPAR